MRGLTGLLFFIVFILLLSFRQGLGLYVDWLWFDKVGYTPFHYRQCHRASTSGTRRSPASTNATTCGADHRVDRRASSGVKLGTVAAFLNPVPFSLNDPLFDVDIGFYVFRLPMLLKTYNWLTFVLTFALLASAAVCLLYRGIIYGPRGVAFSAREATTPAAPVERRKREEGSRPPSTRSLSALAGDATAGQLGWLR